MAQYELIRLYPIRTDSAQVDSTQCSTMVDWFNSNFSPGRLGLNFG